MTNHKILVERKTEKTHPTGVTTDDIIKDLYAITSLQTPKVYRDPDLMFEVMVEINKKLNDLIRKLENTPCSCYSCREYESQEMMKG